MGGFGGGAFGDTRFGGPEGSGSAGGGLPRSFPIGLKDANQPLDAKQAGNRADIVAQRQKRSYMWMRDNFYDEWEQVFKSYKCERNPEKQPNRPNADDPTQTSIGMPDTWTVVRRTVARATAQIPNLRFNAKDTQASELIGRTLMYQWDKAKIQRVQKKHVAQAALFGWSVRPWYWRSDTQTRTRRVNPMKPQLDPADIEQIASNYKIDPAKLQDPVNGKLILAKLLEDHSRGGMLPLRYSYKAYEGPQCDFLLNSDVFPEPNFTSIQKSNWFITERRRNLQWIENWCEAYPEFKAGFQLLRDKYPDGTTWSYVGGSETNHLRRRLQETINRTDQSNLATTESRTKEWTIQEQWVPGQNSTLTLVGESNVFLGEIENPYTLDGMIPFTELVLIDDILSGVGDSTARIMRGLQLLHDRQVNIRTDLANDILRPMMGTSDQQLYEESESRLKRFNGMRLVQLRSQGDLWGVQESNAMAAVSVGMNDESSVVRNIQMLTGETNLSQMANVDPAQARTATGARIMAYNQDTLTKDLVDAFTDSSLNADAEMMYMLNRSELADAVSFDAGRYSRMYGQGEDALREKWVQVEPELFQIDGEITAEVGSTLADDDEAKVTKATNLFHAATQFPQLINAEQATIDFLIAMGKGRELEKWKPQPQGPPPEPEARTSITVSAKWESLTPQEKQAFLNSGKIQLQLVPPNDPELQPPPPPGAPPPGAGGPPPSGPPGSGGPPIGPTPPQPLLAAGALEAARGRSPFNGAPHAG